MLAIHLLNHEGRPEQLEESRVDRLDRHLRWDREFISQVVRGATRRGLVVMRGDELMLTDQGRAEAERALVT